ncbi:MAG: hypothetical protein ACTHJ8_08125 [Mucilaginibacter sp.]|jgi:hypothetical protein
MKHLFTTFLLLTVATSALCQVTPTISRAIMAHPENKKAGKDTVIEKDTSKENKEPRYFYASFNSNVMVNTKGGFAKRFSPGIEFGRTYGICDVGLQGGRISSFNTDSTLFLEFRATLNIFSKGRFAEGLCLGAGDAFGAKQGLMTEICNSLNFNVGTNFAIALTQGYYFFDGTNSSRAAQYMGASFTYNFLRNHSTNKRRKKQALINDN